MKGTSTQPGIREDPAGHETIVGPQRELLDQLLDKWGHLLLAALCQQPRRFNELKRELDGVTQKSLTQALRRLERNGLVERRVLTQRPVAVEYRITPLGRTLEEPFSILRAWTADHLPEVERHRDAFDKGADTHH
ncbi:winged helix-turn-helix transcriptional regulator [Streptomyces sp. NEAU-W12]|uniref:winged helix-turn-helix transcriptional regulator n=1 Tax=Streptomyces sp. NEAU-W12 TaxID=2994668 RepID=UPI00224A982F|nr:helix-turn-helix domain-containing protein [Streptomyces sp. NEAU-W12]MCX2922087.1 helix-turn-helix domain-containing protein [Streptomyces sp. NEAU-W12]